MPVERVDLGFVSCPFLSSGRRKQSISSEQQAINFFDWQKSAAANFLGPVAVCFRSTIFATTNSTTFWAATFIGECGSCWSLNASTKITVALHVVPVDATIILQVTCAAALTSSSLLLPYLLLVDPCPFPSYLLIVVVLVETIYSIRRRKNPPVRSQA